jgi:hypothetical protein
MSMMKGSAVSQPDRKEVVRNVKIEQNVCAMSMKSEWAVRRVRRERALMVIGGGIVLQHGGLDSLRLKKGKDMEKDHLPRLASPEVDVRPEMDLKPDCPQIGHVTVFGQIRGCLSK